MIRYMQLELPARVKAFTVKNEDDYFIVVNSILSRSQQLKEIGHELNHIKNGDYSSELSADSIEAKNPSG